LVLLVLFAGLVLAFLLTVLFLFEAVAGWLTGLVLLFAFLELYACVAAGADARACFGDIAGAL